jgi:hypothetical protein
MLWEFSTLPYFKDIKFGDSIKAKFGENGDWKFGKVFSTKNSVKFLVKF